ncbi:MAG TPA: type II secretion system minor pseudopilin GspK [Burkholderiales bacterium]
MRARERGVALVTAVLIVAVVAALATSLALGQQVWLRQAQNLADLAQAEKLRRGAFEFAAVMLALDGRNVRTSQTDDLTEEWAQPLPPLPVDGGSVLIAIADAQGLFNLNNVAQTPPQNRPPQGGGAPVNYAAMYRALLGYAGIEPARIDVLTDALIDWIDPDSNVRPAGAEDLDYLGHDPPYRAANQPLRSVDELRLIKGYTPEIVEKLRPYVVAITPGGSPAQSTAVPINVNTAPAPVLAALTNRPLSEIEPLVERRARQPFKNAEELGAALGGQAPPAGSYDVKSSYFIVTVETRIGRTQRRTEALLHRPIGGNQKATVLWYRQPAFQIVLDEDESDDDAS